MVLNKKLPIIISLISLLFTNMSVMADKKPPLKVLTSIKPIQLIAQAITEDVTEPEVLLPPGASPHSHSLRPSDARRLQNADVMFWVGPDMEVFLEKMLFNAKSTRSVPMMNAKDIKLRRSGDSEEEHHHHDDGHHHHHGEFDAHIWLSPENAIVMANSISSTLIELDPDNTKKYKSNLKRFISSMKKVDARNKKKLSPVLKRPIFVFHDAYGYLQDHYHLNIAGHFTLNPEQQPGARHLAELRDKLREKEKEFGKVCVFREPQFQPAYINRIVEGMNANVSVLDPLAMDIAEGANAYPEFLQELVDNIVSCLK